MSAKRKSLPTKISQARSSEESLASSAGNKGKGILSPEPATPDSDLEYEEDGEEEIVRRDSRMGTRSANTSTRDRDKERDQVSQVFFVISITYSFLQVRNQVEMMRGTLIIEEMECFSSFSSYSSDLLSYFLKNGVKEKR